MRILLFLLLCLVAQAASAASFPCAKAKSKVEKMICSDAALSKLDEELAAVFKQANTDWSATASDQKAWLRKVRDRCNASECLAKAYRARIEVLEHWHDPTPWSQDMLGQYVEPHQVDLCCGYKPSPIDVSDCLSITREPDSTLRLRLQSFQVNGHSCTVDMPVRKEKDGYRVIPEAGDSCALLVRAQQGLLVLEDPQFSCQDHCGARALMDAQAFRRTQLKPGHCNVEE